MLKKLAVSALLLALISVPALAEEAAPQKIFYKTPQSVSSPEVNAAMNAVYKARGDEERDAAIAAVQKLVDGGNAQAAFRLGRYLHLETRRSDYARAMQLYQFAAGKGDAWAINNIGLLYEDGQGVSQDLGKAVTLFQSAAEKQHYHGFNNMARLYLLGKGVTRDPDKAYEWLQKGCALKLPEVCREAYDIYDEGRYTAPTDKTKAFGFAVKAAALGDTDYQYNLALHYRRGEGTPMDVKKSAEILIPLAAQHHTQAMSALGSAYLEGLGVAEDQSKGIALLEEAAARGYCNASLKLGRLYAGDVKRKDTAKALQYFEKAYEDCDDEMEAGDLSFVGRSYLAGQTVPQDCAKALNFFKAAEEYNYRSAEAYNDLANYYYQGCGGFPSDKNVSFKYLLVAAKLNDKMAQGTVSSLLRHEVNGRAADPVKADAWALVSLEQQEGALPAEATGRVLADKPEAYRKQVMDHVAEIKAFIAQSRQPQKEGGILYDSQRF